MAKPKPETMAVSDFNLQKLSTQSLSKHLKCSIEIGENVAIFGRRGTGKTEISKQEIKNAGLKEVYVNLSVLERVDMGGYPNMLAASQQKDFVDFILPRMYESMLTGDQGVVALLDEVDKADPSLWAPLLEFTQFRSINGRKLPNLVAIIMTGNLISEGGARPSLPLLDRAEKYLVEADAASWLRWAGQSNSYIHPSITAFINDNPTLLFGAVDPEERYGDSSPRGWARSSSIITKGEKLGWDNEILNDKVFGCVGKEAGIKYKHYYAYYQELLPLIEKVFQGENVSKEYNTLGPSKKLIMCMIICARLATILDNAPDGSIPVAIKHVGKYFQYSDYENVLIAVRSQIQVDRIVKFCLDEQPEWEPIISMINDKMI